MLPADVSPMAGGLCAVADSMCLVNEEIESERYQLISDWLTGKMNHQPSATDDSSNQSWLQSAT